MNTNGHELGRICTNRVERRASFGEGVRDQGGGALAPRGGRSEGGCQRAEDPHSLNYSGHQSLRNFWSSSERDEIRISKRWLPLTMVRRSPFLVTSEAEIAVGDTPVLAAGGIGRGRQMAASMALGAQGIWCGSVWLTTEEAETLPAVKEKFLAATSSDTMRSRSRTGKHARMLKSAWTDEWENPETPAPLGMPMQPMLIDDAIRRIDRAAHVPGSGAEQLANYFVGQIVGDMNKTKPARQVVLDIVDEFIDATQSVAKQLES